MTQSKELKEALQGLRELSKQEQQDREVGIFPDTSWADSLPEYDPPPEEDNEVSVTFIKKSSGTRLRGAAAIVSCCRIETFRCKSLFPAAVIVAVVDGGAELRRKQEDRQTEDIVADKIQLHLAGQKTTAPTLEDLIRLFKNLTGREPTPEDVEKARELCKKK